MNQIRFLVVCLVVSLIAFSGCGGRKTAGEKKYDKPTWLKIDATKFAKLSEDATRLEGGTVTVYDPEGWRRMPLGTATPPQGFKSVIVFMKDGATIMMTKSRAAKDMPDLDRDNIEDFAESAQQLFKSPVRMLQIGDMVGVMFAKQAVDKNRISRKLNRRIVATSINGQLFTYELVSGDRITEDLLGALYAVISKTKIEGAAKSADIIVAEGIEAVSDDPVVAAAPTPPEPQDAPATDTAPDVPVAATAPQPAEPVVAATPQPAEPPVAATPKPAEPAKPAPAKDKANTKAILDELDALFN